MEPWGLCKYLDKRSGVIAAVATGIYWMCCERAAEGLQDHRDSFGVIAMKAKEGFTELLLLLRLVKYENYKTVGRPRRAFFFF